MRLWSLHPGYLDAKGIVALWREGLLARAVLTGKTRGYTRHPQLERFRLCSDSVAVIDLYLGAVCDEAVKRGYSFDISKIHPRSDAKGLLTVTDGQLDFEWQHLLAKLQSRDPERYSRYRNISSIDPHPIFKTVTGPVATWEKGITVTLEGAG